jgi:metallo-beta-lactamase family protein
MRSTEESMSLNRLKSKAIIIAGSGMCTGGRILHHLKYNAWRENCHIIIVGYQAMGTTGRKLVDGEKYIRLWGETIRVAAKVHTVGGISAHADQGGLCHWYDNIGNHPPVYLVHGEPDALKKLSEVLGNKYHAPVKIAEYMERIEL